jgi:hypothetical protein
VEFQLLLAANPFRASHCSLGSDGRPPWDAQPVGPPGTIVHTAMRTVQRTVWNRIFSVPLSDRLSPVAPRLASLPLRYSADPGRTVQAEC